LLSLAIEASTDARLQRLVNFIWRDWSSALDAIYQIVQLGSPVHVVNQKRTSIGGRRYHFPRNLLPLRFKLCNRSRPLVGRQISLDTDRTRQYRGSGHRNANNRKDANRSDFHRKTSGSTGQNSAGLLLHYSDICTLQGREL
jgi:hypothetical protein